MVTEVIGRPSVIRRPSVGVRRLAASGIAPPRGGGAAAIAGVVSSQLAMQAQDLASGLWSVGVRTGASRDEVLGAIDDRLITRSWPMRGTLHLMATRDVRWMCRLLGGRAIRATRARFAQLELTTEVVDRARDLLVTTLSGGRAVTRAEAFVLLEAQGITPQGQRGIHLLGRFCQEGLLCQGSFVGRHPTFVLLDEWVPHSWDPGPEEAMATIARRYVATHGPAPLSDLAGWTGQPLGFAREAVALAGDALHQEVWSGVTHLVHEDAPAPASRAATHLLPGFDEFLLGYKDRSAVLTREEEQRVVPGSNGVFLPTVVVGGRVVGTWTRLTRTTRVSLTVSTWAVPTPARRRAIERAGAAYGRFVGLPVELTFAVP